MAQLPNLQMKIKPPAHVYFGLHKVIIHLKLFSNLLHWQSQIQNYSDFTVNVIKLKGICLTLRKISPEKAAQSKIFAKGNKSNGQCPKHWVTSLTCVYPWCQHWFKETLTRLKLINLYNCYFSELEWLITLVICIYFEINQLNTKTKCLRSWS